MKKRKRNSEIRRFNEFAASSDESNVKSKRENEGNLDFQTFKSHEARSRVIESDPGRLVFDLSKSANSGRTVTRRQIDSNRDPARN